jgi:hypothetical protein
MPLGRPQNTLLEHVMALKGNISAVGGLCEVRSCGLAAGRSLVRFSATWLHDAVGFESPRPRRANIDIADCCRHCLIT